MKWLLIATSLMAIYCLDIANGYNDATMYSIAQATCAGLDSTGKSGWMYAVKRTQLGPLTCEQICKDDFLKLQDNAVANYHGQCVNSLAVEHNAQTEDFPVDVLKLGPRTFIYYSCNAPYSNFCCCKYTS